LPDEISDALMLIEAEDREDYESAIKVRKNNKKWMKHEDFKKELGL